MAQADELAIEHISAEEHQELLAQEESPVAISVDTGLGRTYFLRVTPLGSRPVLIAVHL